MKIIHILCLLFPCFAFTQTTTTAPDIEWQRCYGTAGHDGISINSVDGRPSEVGNLEGNIVVLDDGSTVFATNVSPYAGGNIVSSGDITLPTNIAGHSFTWLVKVSPQGSIIWQKIIGDVSIQYIAKTADGGFIISANKLLNGYAANDMVLKVSATGQEQWRKIIHPHNTNQAHYFFTKSIQQTNDGGYICIGMETIYYDIQTPVPSTCTTSNNPYYDANVIITKISATGTTEWQQCMVFGTDQTEYAIAGQQTADGGYIITGAAQKVSNPTYEQNRVILVVKLSSTGSIEWDKKIGDGHFITIACSIFQTTDGGYIVGGSTEENTGVFAGLNPYGWLYPGGHTYSKYAPCFLKLNSMGDIVWTKAIGGAISERCTWVEPTSDGGFIAVSTLWRQLGAPDYPRMTWVTKHNANGEIEWDKYIGGYVPYREASGNSGYHYNGGQCIRETPDGGYMVYGYAFQNGADICGNWEYDHVGQMPPQIDPTQDIWLCKLKTLPAEPKITGNLALVCTSTTTLTAEQPLPQPTPPASYLWSNNATTQAITGVTAGTYTVTITYENRCTKSTSVTVQASSIALPASGIVYTPSGCTAATGSATLTATGGLAPYIYTCASGSVSANTISSLAAGTYTVSITDANGCTGSTNITIPQAANNLQATATATQILCAGGTGSISVSVTNGIAPFTYAINGGASSANNVFSALAAANYTVVATDFTGCTASTSAIINAAPLPLTATTTTQNTTCGQSNGSLTANVSGGTAPYMYAINGGPSSANNVFSNLLTGNYIVTITDANGCSFVASSANILGNPPITANITTAPTHCYSEASGSIAISNVQNAVLPVLYSLDNQMLNGTNPIINILGGTHNITIEDATGCKLETTASVAEGPRFTVSIGRDTVLNFGDSLLMIGNTTSGFPQAPTVYTWTCTPSASLRIGNRSATVRAENTGICTLLVTDARGCTATDALNIRIKDASSIYIPNAFTPNNDGINDQFVIFGGSQVERVVLLRIFDRLGELVFEKADFDPNTPAWNGSFRAKDAPQNVYVYYTQIRMRSGEVRTMTGDVTLLR